LQHDPKPSYIRPHCLTLGSESTQTIYL